MKISIFTPSHDSRFLPELYNSIREQDFYEWVVLLNNGAEPISFPDDRVKVFRWDGAPAWVGPLKKRCCEYCTGDILLEVDHDDLLMPTAVADVKAVFTDPEIGFVYSNTVHSDRDFNNVGKFSEYWGWKYRTVQYSGRELDEHISFPPTPDSISRIWFAPNHLRAFRRDLYVQVGGHNPEMRILDDLDLMCRLYQVTKFKHVDKGLYIYRVHGENTWLRYNAEIQNNVYRIYDQYIEDLVLRWANLGGLAKLDLGGGINPRPGYISVDCWGGNVVANLEDSWPFRDNSVGVIRAADCFEHLRDPIHTMKEAYRVLVPGGWILSVTPSTDGRGAFQDPTHVSFWNENSFKYYTDREMAKYIHQPVRFQAPRLYTTEKNGDQVCWVVAHLVSLKDGYRPAGEIKI